MTLKPFCKPRWSPLVLRLVLAAFLVGLQQKFALLRRMYVHIDRFKSGGYPKFETARSSNLPRDNANGLGSNGLFDAN